MLWVKISNLIYQPCAMLDKTISPLFCRAPVFKQILSILSYLVPGKREDPGNEVAILQCVMTVYKTQIRPKCNKNKRVEHKSQVSV